MMRNQFCLALLALTLASLAAGAADDSEFFEKRIRPVLATNCYACHGSDKQSGGLRLDSRGGGAKWRRERSSRNPRQTR